MKRNNFMFFTGLLLVFGSMFGIPMIGMLVSFLMGDKFDQLLSANSDSLPVITIVIGAVVVLVPVIGVFLMIGSVLIPLFSSMSGQRKVIDQGLDAEAKILALSDTGTRINNNPLVNFTLEVYPQTQPPFRAEASQTVSVIHLPSYQPGKIVNVKYLPGTYQVTIIGAKFV